jgi:hypothetical protein
MSEYGNERQPATQSDVDQGRAVFWIPDRRSKVYDLGFRLPAECTTAINIPIGEKGQELPAGTPLTVIQAEIVDDTDVLLGFTYGNGEGCGVCSLEEVRFTPSRG